MSKKLGFNETNAYLGSEYIIHNKEKLSDILTYSSANNGSQVGTWINGKPIYRKVYSFSIYSSTQILVIDKLPSNYTNFVFAVGNIVKNSGAIHNIGGFFNNEGSLLEIYNGNINLYLSNDYLNQTLFGNVILYYI